ncbi:ISA1083-3 transposase [Methanohalobium evestigatum Z-7303]|uniref:ISA1083-3 transposase n=1 Tax=Methanohalobium evestigatum (strain ATCC BAA-1072 / DSM 3721 / NBRC 107634 / OCM 161 / Z-7303) TaxID=644295 RepID=D7E7B1_METEZ|nr:ISA1083-3 transposase [Methanohalobium evestigatum Z-7303]ADI73860.1 ISA1083-3 transposase [Methanohalobium evestigatum Z-7303]
MDENTIIGFLDETSPQNNANTLRFWSFNKPQIYRNTWIKVNTLGFYALNGKSVIEFSPHSKKEDVCEFLMNIRKNNPDKRIVIILDNFRSHHAKTVVECAANNGIELVYLPPYSPELNPIEFIWKSIRRVISGFFAIDTDHMKQLIYEAFMQLSANISFAKGWIKEFIVDKFIQRKLCY